MLVLTRKYNQSIMLGDQIEIVIVEVKGDQVKIGINAPRDMTILRTEIYKQIKAENELAIKTPKQEDLSKALGSIFGSKKETKTAAVKPVVKMKKPKNKKDK